MIIAKDRAPIEALTGVRDKNAVWGSIHA
jgi:hypothetical protein